MSKSLQDQLRELGLAREPAARPERRKEHQGKARARAPRRPEPQAPRDLSLEEAYRLRAQAEEAAARQVRLAKQAEDARRRELNQAIREIAEPHRLNDPAAEEPRYFLYKGRIRKVQVTPEQLVALNEGRLGIVYLAGHYHLLLPEHVEAVRRISPEHVPDLTGSDDDSEPASP